MFLTLNMRLLKGKKREERVEGNEENRGGKRGLPFLCTQFRFDAVAWGCLICCCLHIKSRSGLYSVLSNIRTGPTDADAFRGHRLTTQKRYTYQKEIKRPRKVNTHAIIGK